jgi:hypothetical protein
MNDGSNSFFFLCPLIDLIASVVWSLTCRASPRRRRGRGEGEGGAHHSVLTRRRPLSSTAGMKLGQSKL